MSSASEVAMMDASIAAPVAEAESGCHHYWVIEAPNGSSSVGVCKFCKVEKEFTNSMDRYLIRKKARAQQQARLAAAARRAA